MDELIGRVTQRAGIDDDQARSAIDAVLGFLKERLPAPIAGQLDSVVSGGGGGGAGGGIPDLGGLGGMLGGERQG